MMGTKGSLEGCGMVRLCMFLKVELIEFAGW